MVRFKSLCVTESTEAEGFALSRRHGRPIWVTAPTVVRWGRGRYAVMPTTRDS